MGLDLFWNPITDTISLIKKKEKKNKYKEKYAYINQQRGFPRELIVAFQYLKGAYEQEGQHLLHVLLVIGQGEWF